jgi:hypothetical protein
MPSLEETYIVRVRSADADAVIEQVRSRRRLHVDDLSEIGAAIARLAAPTLAADTAAKKGRD